MKLSVSTHNPYTENQNYALLATSVASMPDFTITLSLLVWLFFWESHIQANGLIVPYRNLLKYSSTGIL